jgi:hypothetical protein
MPSTNSPHAEERPGEAAARLLLDREDVGELAIVRIGSDMVAGRGVYQLRGDTDPAAGFAHRPFQHIALASSAPTCFTSTAQPLYVKALLRAMTKNQRTLESAVVISSTMPSRRLAPACLAGGNRHRPWRSSSRCYCGRDGRGPIAPQLTGPRATRPHHLRTTRGSPRRAPRARAAGLSRTPRRYGGNPRPNWPAAAPRSGSRRW